MSIAFGEIKGLSELLAETRQSETVNREDAWLAATYFVAGQRIRTMTVDDFTALLQFNSPLLSRKTPNPDELILFLWILSGENLRLRNSKLPKVYCQWRAKRFGKRMRRLLNLDAVESERRRAEAKGETYTLPDESPLAKAIESAFKYIDLLFMDRPPGLARNGLDSGLCYLTSWFDAMQSEYHLPTNEIWAMPLPVLFARLKAIQFRRFKNVPTFNQNRDRIFANIMAGLNGRLFSEDDLRAGRVDLVKCKLKEN